MALVFYPSCVAHIYLRFDEALHLLDTPLPRPLSVGGYTAQAPAAPVTRPLVTQAGKDNLSVISNRLPKECNVTLSGYRSAGKWSLAFDYRDFPVDPRIARAVAVEIHLGTVAAEGFAAGMSGARDGGGRASVIGTREHGVMRQDTLLIYGLADSIHTEWSDKGAWCRMEGRDLRGLMLDAGARPAMLAKLDLSKNIVEVVQQIIALHTFGEKITVAHNVGEWPGQVVPSPGDAAGMTRVNLDAAGQRSNNQPQGDPSKLSVWDIITNYCTLCGAVPYFVGQELRVRPARSLYQNLFDPNVRTPFADGQPRAVQDGSGAPKKLKVRQMVFGRDIGSLEFERKLGGTKVPQVEVVSLDTSSKKRGGGKLLIAKYPDDGENPVPGAAEEEALDPAQVDDANLPPTDAATTKQLTNNVSPGGQVQKQVIRIPVAGINDIARLKQIAYDLWHEIGRGEMGGKVSTKTLTSFGGSAADPDLLSLRPGDPVELVFDVRALGSQPPLSHEVTDHQRRSFEEEVAFVKERLDGDENLARVLVATARNQVAELQSFFRVSNIAYAWSAEGGVEVQFDFQNFLESRFDADRKREQVPATKVQKTSVGGPSKAAKAAPPAAAAAATPPARRGILADVAVPTHVAVYKPGRF